MSRVRSIIRRSGARYSRSSSPARNCASTRRASSGRRDELRKAARTPAWLSAATWSCISEISGETTMPVPIAHQRRDLVAQRLAAAGRHQHQGVAASDQVGNHLVLGRTETVVAEDASAGYGWPDQASAHGRAVPGTAAARFPAGQRNSLSGAGPKYISKPMPTPGLISRSSSSVSRGQVSWSAARGTASAEYLLAIADFSSHSSGWAHRRQSRRAAGACS